jgi:ATP-dependent DNA helicase RecQ
MPRHPRRPTPPRAAIHEVAREKLGLPALRAAQEEAIHAALAGRDTLCVMPTGSGKSAIYQIAGHLIPRATVIVSPLIALQRDQLEALTEADVGDAAAVNSLLAARARREALASLADGGLEFLFLAPEQLGNPDVLDPLRAAAPSLFVVDEAHCISQWGHDFRPDYLKLGAVVEALGRPTILALTATASPRVREDIVRHLGMRDPYVLVRGFDRPNLFLEVRTFEKPSEKRAALVAAVAEAEKPGIVYAATRKYAEALAAELGAHRVRAVAYHAGLRRAARDAIQSAFMDGDADVIVATSAFGMGVDKPNVRFVFHHDASDSLDAYYQEIGRAGRDGEPARATLFYRPQDLGLHRFFAASGRVTAAEVARVVTILRARAERPSFLALAEEAALSRAKLAHAIGFLHELRVVERSATGEVRIVPDDRDAHALGEEALAIQEWRRGTVAARIDLVRAYAEASGCRRGAVLRYFGEEGPDACAGCDNCTSGRTARVAARMQAESPAASAAAVRRPRARRPPAPARGASAEAATIAPPFPVDSWVHHDEWGRGRVLGCWEDKIKIDFDDEGEKTLALAVVLSRRLLAPVASLSA